MSWKKALFLGGAVMLLAACSDATAPRPMRTTNSGTAAVTSSGTISVTGTVSTGTSVDPITGLLDDCRSGYYVRSGDKDICISLY